MSAMSLGKNTPPTSKPASGIKITHSRNFLSWLRQHNISLALSTYQSSRLMLIGTTSQGAFSGFERIFNRAMGLCTTTDGERIYLAGRDRLWQLDNVLAPGQLHNNHDKLYIPRIGYTTGDIDTHDVAIDKQGRVLFISTLFNCIATLSHKHSCQPLWKPAFISKVINEDRCHLNGLAMVAGEAKYVTACSRSDVVDGWREKRSDGGCVIEVESNEIVATGLSMPHSPRWYRDKLWLHNSGTGEFGYIDLEAGRFEPVVFCPGYLRGLAFVGDYALMGLSMARDATFTGLQLQQTLAAKDVSDRCGVMVIDLNTTAVVEWLNFTGEVTELYDIQVLAGARQPMALGFQTDEIARLLTVEPIGSLGD